MAVVIRMKRTGRKNRPCYRISVADSALAPTARTLDTLGVYDPASPVESLRLVGLDKERARHWLEKGAVPSETVRSILKREGVLEGLPERKKRTRTGRNKPTAKKTKREARKSAVVEAKTARHNERVAAKRAAAKAAAAEAAADESSDES